MENEGYKSCFIPFCKSSTFTTPQKEFVRLPSNQKEVSEAWEKFSKHSTKKLPKRFVFCCKDHLDILFQENVYSSGSDQKIVEDQNIIENPTHPTYGLSERFFEHLCSVQVLLDKRIVDNYLKTKDLVPVDSEKVNFSHQYLCSSYGNNNENKDEITRSDNEDPLRDLEDFIIPCEPIPSDLKEESIQDEDSKGDSFMPEMTNQIQYLNEKQSDDDLNCLTILESGLVINAGIEHSKYFINGDDKEKDFKADVKIEDELDLDDIFNDQMVASTNKSGASNLHVNSDVSQEVKDEEMDAEKMEVSDAEEEKIEPEVVIEVEGEEEYQEEDDLNVEYDEERIEQIVQQSGVNECMKCHKKFITYVNLKKHEPICDLLIFDCEYCSKTFRRLFLLKRHLKRLHDDIVSLEEIEMICEELTLQREQLRAKANLSIQQKIIQLNLEERQSKVRDFVNTSKKLHCTYCDITFDTCLSKTCPKCGSQGYFKCETCEKDFFFKGNYLQHLASECTKESSFMCSDCDFKTNSLNNLLKHKNNVHCIQNKQRSLKIPNLQCHAPPEYTSRASESQPDVQINMNRIPHLLENDYSTSEKSMITEGIEHTSELDKNHCDKNSLSMNHKMVCSKCKKKFKIWRNYEVHKVVCMVRYKCTHCNETFDKSGRVREHLYSCHQHDLLEREFYGVYLTILREREDIIKKIKRENKEFGVSRYPFAANDFQMLEKE